VIRPLPFPLSALRLNINPSSSSLLTRQFTSSFSVPKRRLMTPFINTPLAEDQAFPLPFSLFCSQPVRSLLQSLIVHSSSLLFLRNFFSSSRNGNKKRSLDKLGRCVQAEDDGDGTSFLLSFRFILPCLPPLFDARPGTLEYSRIGDDLAFYSRGFLDIRNAPVFAVYQPLLPLFLTLLPPHFPSQSII